MKNLPFVGEAATRPVTTASDAGAGLELNIIYGGALRTLPLPAQASLAIGRSGDVAVRVDDPTVSRRHVVIHVGNDLVLEDAGSANGTRIAGRQLRPGERRPFSLGETIELGLTVLMVLPAHFERRPVGTTDEPSGPGTSGDKALSSIVVRDPQLVKLHELAQRVARGNISVLVLGETGSGKEIFAEVVHRHSPRHSKPLLRLNCAALTESLLESELFGHERGAFTGADKTKPGLLEAAEGGTVLFDEVGELPLALQAKLLRVLQDKRVMRVGGLKPRDIDVRFVAATNRLLNEEVERGRFRADLLYRLNGVTLVVPPLRERPSELEELAQLFVRRAAEMLGRPAPWLSATALTALRRYTWPGNIRELSNVIERSVLVAGDVPELTDEHLLFEPPPTWRLPVATQPERVSVADEERQRVIEALAEHNGNQTYAAAALGMARSTLVAKMVAYRLPRPRKPHVR
jgi:two-component system response regulator AtoC